MTGEFTQTIIGTPIGAIASMYDLDPAVSYKNHAGTGTSLMTWKMEDRTKFKTIYVYLALQDSGIGTITVTLQGSQNGIDFDDLDTATSPNDSVFTFFNLTAADISYRYIRLKGVSATTTTNNIYIMHGVI